MKRIIAKSGFATLTLLGLFAVSQTATAAELVKLEGKVSVNRGDGFEPAKQGMVLKVGDQVLVGKESAASLVYAEPGCVLEVPEASVVTVSDVGPCIPGQTTALGESVFVTPAATDGTTGDLTPFYVMGGGAVIGATALIINEASKDSGNRPPRPGASPGNGGGFGGVSFP
jgi:hypothetical protein